MPPDLNPHEPTDDNRFPHPLESSLGLAGRRRKEGVGGCRRVLMMGKAMKEKGKGKEKSPL